MQKRNLMDEARQIFDMANSAAGVTMAPVAPDASSKDDILVQFVNSLTREDLVISHDYAIYGGNQENVPTTLSAGVEQRLKIIQCRDAPLVYSLAVNDFLRKRERDGTVKFVTMVLSPQSFSVFPPHIPPHLQNQTSDDQRIYVPSKEGSVKQKDVYSCSKEWLQAMFLQFQAHNLNYPIAAKLLLDPNNFTGSLKLKIDKFRDKSTQTGRDKQVQYFKILTNDDPPAVALQRVKDISQWILELTVKVPTDECITRIMNAVAPVSNNFENVCDVWAALLE